MLTKEKIYFYIFVLLLFLIVVFNWSKKPMYRSYTVIEYKYLEK